MLARRVILVLVLPLLSLGLPAVAAAQDLAITSTTAPASGSTAGAGAAFTVNYSLMNASSTAFTTNFYVSFYYCTSASTTSCTYMTNFYIQDNFAANQTRTYTRALSLPTSVLYGTGYIRFFVDATNLIAESNENNNNAYDAISVTTRPDLSVQTAEFPYTGTTTGPGSTFTGRVIFRNAPGTSRLTANFDASFYYCPTQVFVGCTLLGNQTVTTDLDSGATTGYVTTPTLTLPSTATAGTRYILVRVDPSNTVVENNENNNTYFDSITVTSSGNPDLQIIQTQAPLTGSTAAAGSQFTVRAWIRNSNNASFTTNFYLNYYYCPSTTTVITSCTYLGQNYVTDDFAAQQIRNYTSSMLTLPTTVVYGTGYIRFWVDATSLVTETNETNNTDNDAISISTLPDLTDAIVTAPASGSTVVGSTFTATATVSNKAASSAVTGSPVLAWYLCPAMSTTGCTSLGTQTLTLSLASGATSSTITSPTLTIPTTATPGTQYLRAYVDSTNVISEQSGTNNDAYKAITITAATPDLAFVGLSAPASGSTAGAGSTFTLKATVKNLTTASFTTDFYLYYYYCPTATATSCTLLGQNAITDDYTSGLVKTYTSPTLTIPTTAVAGTAYVRFFVDATSLVKETNENNNSAYRPITITKLPDLQIASSLVPASGSASKPGDTFTASYGLLNAASTSAFSTNFQVSYSFCTAMSQTSCTLLATSAVTQDFNSGGTYTQVSPTLTIPTSAASGTAYIRVFVDSGAAITEGSETNNEKYDAITISGTSQPDYTISTFTATVSGTQVTYSVTVCNQGDTATTGFTLSLYYNLSAAPTCASTADHSFTISALAKSGCQTVSTTRTNVKPGLYLDWAFADSACAATESSETNNTKSVAYSVLSLPDQGVADLTPPDAGVPDKGLPPDLAIADTGIPADLPVADTGVPADLPVADTGIPADLPVADADLLTDLPINETGTPADLPMADIEGGLADLPMTDTEAGGDLTADAPVIDGPKAETPMTDTLVTQPEAGQDLKVGDLGGDKGGSTGDDDGGCNCETAGQTEGSLVAGLPFLLIFAGWWIRRRKRG